MKTLKTLSICALLALTSCASFNTWWQKPETQEAVEKSSRVALSIAFQTASLVAQQYLSGQKVQGGDVLNAALSAGASTLFTQASALRQVQGTADAVDPVAIAQALQENGTPKALANKNAGLIAANAVALIAAGLTADKANELQASAFDKAAEIYLNK